MKAKHTIARVKGLAIWQKIFCALLALTLLSLMIPSGLRAVAATPFNGEPTNESTEETQAEEVITNNPAPLLGETQAEANGEVNALDFQWPRVNSTADFVRNSWNSEATAGYFQTQKVDATVVQLVEALLPYVGDLFRSYGINSVADIKDEASLAAAINALDQCAVDNGESNRTSMAGWLYLMLNKLMKQEDVHQDTTADFTNAVWVPHIPIDPEKMVPEKVDDPNDRKKPDIPEVLNALNYINSMIMLDYQKMPHLENALHVKADGSVIYIYVTLGEGNLLEKIAGAAVHVARIIPIIPEMRMFHTNQNAFQSNGAEADENVQAFFTGWEVSFDGGKSFIPTEMLEEIMESRTIPLYNDSHYVFRANFFDVEGLVQVHLDFDQATVDEELAIALTKENWWCTDVISMGTSHGGSYWTTVYPDWMPTWAVYADIFRNFGELIFDDGEVYKDELIHDDYVDYGYDIEGFPYPGPHWMESDNPDPFGLLGQETTLKFSWYPVTPRGQVSHANLKSLVPGKIGQYLDPYLSYIAEKGYPINKGFEVGYADVMYYNEWGFPLFNYGNEDGGGAQYGKFMNYWTEDAPPIGYYFFDESGDYPDYCYDQQIDHAVIKAYGWNEDVDVDSEIPYTHDFGTVYIPLRVDKDQLWEMQKDFVFTGTMDFDVESLMMAGFAPGFPVGLDSYEVSYYEDGELLFDPVTISNFWEMQFFAMPMATGGTLAVDANGTLVSSFNAYFDYWRPWAADKLNAFGDPSQFDPTPGVSHTFQCEVRAIPSPGYMVHGWNYDLLFNMHLGDVMPLTDFVIGRHLISTDFVQAGSVDIQAGAGHATFHMDLYNNDDPNPFGCFDFPAGTQNVYAGTKIIVSPDGTIHSVHDDSGLLVKHVETGVIAAVPAEGFQLASWTINGVNYPVGTAGEAATVNADAATSIVANYVAVGGGTPVNPEDIGGGTAQTSDGMGFAFAILAMIAIAGAGVLAGRKLYNK